MNSITCQRDAIATFAEQFDRIENVSGNFPLYPYVFAAYKAYKANKATDKPQSLSDFLRPIADEIEERFELLESATGYHIPQRAASACPIIAGMKVSVGTEFLFGLSQTASKWRKDIKRTVRENKNTTSIAKQFGIDDTNAVPEELTQAVA